MILCPDLETTTDPRFLFNKLQLKKINKKKLTDGIIVLTVLNNVAVALAGSKLRKSQLAEKSRFDLFSWSMLS